MLGLDYFLSVKWRLWYNHSFLARTKADVSFRSLQISSAILPKDKNGLEFSFGPFILIRLESQRHRGSSSEKDEQFSCLSQRPICESKWPSLPSVLFRVFVQIKTTFSLKNRLCEPFITIYAVRNSLKRKGI